jgi:hypothetical protein
VVARFDGGVITSDGGGVLLREVEKRAGITRQFAACFTDHRDPGLIEHPVQDLVAQRVYALALGYEDLNDHDELRRDPLLATLVGKADPTGRRRVRARDAGKALAGKSTLNRLELTRHTRRRPGKSFWIWMRRTTRCTASRRDGSSTATTAAIVTCRCTSSVASIYCVLAYGARTSMARRGRGRRCSAS